MLTRKRKWLIGIGITVAVCLVLLLGGVLWVRHAYYQALQPVSTSQNITLVTVPIGSSPSEIASMLKEKGLIKETWAFEWYIRSNGLRDQLKAGTYALRPSQGIEEIAQILAQGEVATELVTILPGQRLDQIEASLINSGFSPEEVQAALDPSLYAGHPALVDKPASASLEGYLFPESFQKTAETTPEDIIRASLDEMQKRLTPEVRAAIAKRGLSVHEGITLASMVEQEASNPADRATVAQVFLLRLINGIRLESDVTAFYGSIINGQKPSVLYDSPYNTYLHDGLPIGPISNISESSLLSVTNPSATDYLYFVAGDDGKTYFSHTLQEHEALTAEHCKALCQ